MIIVPKIRFLSATCPLGELLLACSEDGLCSILLADNANLAADQLATEFPHTDRLHDHRLQAALQQIIDWLEAPHSPLQLGLPLAASGTAFQQSVWQALRNTRPGERLSYRALAERLGKPAASRAVASACAANPLALFTPCHRVIRSDGQLAGYRWGLARKQQLLHLEQAATLEQSP